MNQQEFHTVDTMEPSPHEYEDGECIRCGCREYPPEVCVPVEARTVSRPEPRDGNEGCEWDSPEDDR